MRARDVMVKAVATTTPETTVENRSEEERRALRVVAENISGVRGIEDHMISGPRYLPPLFPAI